MALSVEVAGRTDVGCVRLKNEDAWGYDAACGIYVVCDGMGGQAAGEIASHLGVEAVLDYFREGRRGGKYPITLDLVDGLSERANRLGNAIFRANRMVYDAAARDPENAGMGSTIICVLAEEEGVSFGHVGDSRIYLVRAGEIRQLTNDHSLVMEQVRRGMMTLQEARTSSMQNIIMRALGTEPTVDPDLEDITIQSGDVLVMCSDGLTRHIPDESICDVVVQIADLKAACDMLVEGANDAGGEDNITCMLLRFRNDSAGRNGQ
ncbi:MAG TPA: Stp1/IreP family PP2C-type Ser/Thr phosphatase [Terriglobales bacterium]|jgi:protein phosphatase|nr:Stp1/IreP family PP2C-type Ser/Thr phosphatase [Terriglobales bacterium]